VTCAIYRRMITIKRLMLHTNHTELDVDTLFFLVNHVFRFLQEEYMLTEYYNTTVVEQMELTLYIVYSYFGPDTAYRSELFCTKFADNESLIFTNFSNIIVDIVMNTDLPKRLLQLEMNR
jgi:hypothetical protein